MGTLTFTHTSTGSEPKPGLIEGWAIQNWTGVFTFSISASSIGSGDIYNIDWRLVRSSDSLVCFSSSGTMFTGSPSSTETWTVNVTGTWNALNWDRFELRYGTASDRVDAGIVLTAVFDGAGITGGTSNSMALVYTLSTTTLDRDLDERYIPKAIMTTKGDVIVGAAATNPVRLGVGADGYVLTSRASASNGVAWEAGSIPDGSIPDGSITSAKIADGTIATIDIGNLQVTNAKLAAGAATANVGTLGGVLGGTLPSPTLAAGAAATNVGTLSGVLGGTLPSPTLAAGAAATNVGTLGGVLTGTLPNPGLASASVTTTQIADGTIATVDLANAAVTNAKLGSDTARANLLTNGGFEIWQRGNGPFTTDSAYIADRWRTYLPVGTLSITKDTANADNSGACAAVVVGGGPSAGNPQQILQYPVHPGDNNMAQQVSGRTLTFSARVKTTVASGCRLVFNPTGGTQVFSSYHPGGGAWATLTVTGTMPATTSGIGALTGVQFEANGTYYVDNASLVVGSQPADYVPMHPADDLARCLRYYEKIKAAARIPATGNQSMWTPLPFKTSMPVTPTITAGTPDFTANLQAGSPTFPNPTADGGALLIVSNATGDAYWMGPVTLESNP